MPLTKKLKNEEEKRVQQVRSGRKGERNPKKAPTHARSPGKKEQGNGKGNTRDAETQTDPGRYEINAVIGKNKHKRKIIPLSVLVGKRRECVERKQKLQRRF